MGSSAAEIQAEIHERILKDNAEQLRKANRNMAAQAAAYARAIAPVGEAARDSHPGQFRDSIHDEAAPDRNGLPASRIVSRSPGAESIEYGTKRTGEHGTFAKVETEFSAAQGRRITDEKA